MYKIIKNHFDIFVLLFYSLLSIITFWKLPSTFFQQDEWAIFGYHLYWDKANLSWFERLFTYEQFTHITPLSNFFGYLQNKIFGLNFPYYAHFSIFIHLFNAFLVFYLGKLIFKRKLMGFIVGVIFLIDSIPHKAITWTATTMGTAGSVLFILISLIFLTKYTLYSSKRGYILLSIFFFLISLGFSESSLFMLLFIPIFWLTFNGIKDLKKFSKILFPIVGAGIIYVFPRIILTIINSNNTIMPEGLNPPALGSYIYRVFTLPLKAVAQSIVPADYVIKLANKLILFGYPDYFAVGGNINPFVSQTIGSDLISYVIAIFIFSICLFLYIFAKKNKLKTEGKLFLISIIFISLSSLPFIFIPGLPGYFSLFDGRYLYLTNIFKSILLLDIFLVIYFIGKKKILYFCLFIFLLFSLINIVRINKDIEIEVKQGILRQSILSRVQQMYPEIPKKVIVYTQSDTSYYGLPLTEPIMPFQSGFGQTLLLWYYKKGEDFPTCFFRGEFLYQITEEGYRECDGRGFGYFRKLDNLKKAYKENKLTKENIIAFSYISSANSLIDITKEIQEKL